MTRAEWLNLNGVWEFAETDDTEDTSFLTSLAYPEKILVPFCRESKLSGIERRGYVKNVWYKRTFSVPSGWNSPKVRLHIGACDYKTTVWLNGHLLGEHIGGHMPFSFEITKYLKAGENTVIIRAFDDQMSMLQAQGKQARGESKSCFYTRTTGIWQTVWIEGIGSSYIGDCRIESDPDNSRILLQSEIEGPSKGLTLKAVAKSGDKVVGSAELKADWRNNLMVIDLSEKRLWSIEDPFLYNLELTLMRGDEVIDKVESYFGLRKVAIEGAAILINDKPVFQRTILDQGYYPEGIWTAPSDEALKGDILLSMAAGFNGARLHEKIFEPRFLYWADKLGYICWGEYPSFGPDYNKPEVNLPIIDEWVAMVRRDRNHPSIIGWCAFNEMPSEVVPIQNTIYYITRLIDPSRPVMDTSHTTHGIPNPEILDMHDYEQNVKTFAARWNGSFGLDLGIPTRYNPGTEERFIPYWVSEMGGIGWAVDGESWAYGDTPKSLEEVYERYDGLMSALLDSRMIFGFCYTQLTDVEQEKNGIYTYERKLKFDMDKIKAITSRKAAYEIDPPLEPRDSPVDWKVLVGAFPDGELCKEWSYTTEKPADDWTNPEFDSSAWQKAVGGFGQKEDYKWAIKTPWTTEEIWMRQEFDYDGAPFEGALLVTQYDYSIKIYLNGVQILKADGWNNKYAGFDLSELVKANIKPGKNTLAIYCKGYGDRQFIDAALLVGNRKK